MIIGFCMGLANGFVIPVAQRYGAKDYKDMRRFVANSIWLTVFFAAIMSITVCILCRSVLIAMKTPADILDLAYDYIFIIFAGIPITLAYNLLTGIIRSLGDSKSPLIFLLMAAVANIGFDRRSWTGFCDTACTGIFRGTVSVVYKDKVPDPENGAGRMEIAWQTHRYPL